jgi:hypothetical protein
MKRIILSNPIAAQKMFSEYGWTDESKYSMRVESTFEETLCSALKCQSNLSGHTLNIGFGKRYSISLDDYSDDVVIELKRVENLGVLLYINQEPYFLRVFRSSLQEEIEKIGAHFPELRIVDFGSSENSVILNLDGLKGCRRLHTLNLDKCPNLLDISGLKNFHGLKVLWLDGFSNSEQFNFISDCKSLESLSQNSSELVKVDYVSDLRLLKNLSIYGNESLTDLSPLIGLTSLTNLDLSGCISITDLSPLKNHTSISILNLSFCESLTDLSPLKNHTSISILNLSFCESLTDLSALTGLTSLRGLNLEQCGNSIDLTPLSSLNELIELNLSYNINLTDLSPLNELSKLSFLYFIGCQGLADLAPLKNHTSITILNLSYCEILTDLSPLIGLTSLTNLDLTSCKSLSDLSPLKNHTSITMLNLSYCESLTDLSPLIGLTSLTKLELSGCDGLTIFPPLQGLSSLSILDFSYCNNLTRVGGISSMTALSAVNLEGTPHIRDFEKLSQMPQLRELTWIDSVACSMVLMATAVIGNDSAFISKKASEWIKEIALAKEAKGFSLKLLSCLNLLKPSTYKGFLFDSLNTMRSRGLQSEERNDLDACTWEMWCSLALDLDKADSISCLQGAVQELDIVRESEVILGPVVMACADLMERHPEEKDALRTWVNEQLQLLNLYPEEQRQIAPSAAVFFAFLNQRDEVLLWLQIATNEKAPLWRDLVLHALVKHYAKKENFTEARQLIDEMQVQDEKDHAISALAKAMAASHPVEAGFLLDEIQEAKISSESARLLLLQPSMLTAPQGLYQLLLHMQSNPDELASALEIIIERDVMGSIADAIKQLFIQAQVSGPSAAILLELCKHPSIADFVKPRSLEKYKSELQERANQELNQSIPYLITEMQNASLLEEEEAKELLTLMQTK